MTEKTHLESLDGWWNEMNLFQKKMVQGLVQMLGGPPIEEELVGVHEAPYKMEIKLVMCRAPKEPDAGTSGSAYRSN